MANVKRVLHMSFMPEVSRPEDSSDTPGFVENANHLKDSDCIGLFFSLFWDLAMGPMKYGPECIGSMVFSDMAPTVLSFDSNADQFNG